MFRNTASSARRWTAVTSIPGLSGIAKASPDRSAIISQAHCSASVKGPGVIANYIIKP